MGDTVTTPTSNPASRYKTPDQLLRDPALPLREKRRLLEAWEEDLRQQLVATEEGMTGPAPVELADILKAKDELPIDTPARAPTPTKA